MPYAVCHLLLVLIVFTSQLRAQLPAQPQSALPSAGAPRLGRHVAPQEEVTIKAHQQEKIGDLYRLRGQVEILYRNFTLRADEITYNASTGEATANGHVVFEGGTHDERIEASSATYNVKTESGQFHNVFGTTGLRFRGRNVQLTSANPFYFQGRLVEKIGRDLIIVHQGRVTSCEMPNPKWLFAVEKAIVEPGNEARLYHSTFRVLGVPVFYLPYAAHPVNKIGRQTGFLIPTLGQSSRKGTILGESFYWTINRSLDTTIGAEYFSHRGWAQHGEFRARPTDSSFLNIRYFGVLDRGTGVPKVDQGGQDVHLNGEARLPYDTRAVADLEYLSSFVFRLAFAESFTQAVNSEVRSNAFVSKIQNGFFFNAAASRYQNFQSAQRGDLITLVRAPGLDLDSVEHRLGSTPLRWSYDFAIQGVSRREPEFVTAPVVGRIDASPRLALPLFLRGWSLRPELALRETYYTQSRLPVGGVGQVSDTPVSRRAVEGSFELRPPSLSRIFDRAVLGHSIKHAIEPRVTYRAVAGVNNAAEIVRFDWRDILSDTNEVEYALVNRLYAKPLHPGGGCAEQAARAADVTGEEGEPEGSQQLPRPEMRQQSLEQGLAGKTAAGCTAPTGAREILRWEIAQKAFFDETFGGALVNGRRNVFTTSADFSGIAFLTEPRRFSPLISRLRVVTSRATDLQWNLDYDTRKGRINASTAIASLRVGEFFVGGSHAFLRVPGEVFVSRALPAPAEFNQFRWIVGYGNPNKRGISAAANIGFDVSERFLQYSAFQTSYNWDCCGLSFEYRRFALGSVRNENQFRFAFSLTNVGTFGTLRRQERLF